MSIIQQSIYSILSGNAPLVALVADRIYPVVLPADAAVWPSVTFALISGSSDLTLAFNQISEARVQFDAWGDGLLAVQSVGAALDAAVNGFTGTVGGRRVLVVYATISQDSFEDAARIYRVMQEYTFVFA